MADESARDRSVTLLSGYRGDERRIYATAFILFGIAAALTARFVLSMSGGMSMPGRWTMSMMWMPMPGQPWIEAAFVFLGMWVAMMIAMMLPSTLPMLLIYRRTLLFRRVARPDLAMWSAAAGYFAVWTAFGVVVYALGISLAKLAMASAQISRGMPLLSGGALVLAGVYQLTPWKFACLQHCRDPHHALIHYQKPGAPRREWINALRIGMEHGAFCAACCWALMLIQMILGVMSMAAMIGVAAVIAIEKLVVRGVLVAQLVGIAAIVGGLIVIVLSVGVRG